MIKEEVLRRTVDEEGSVHCALAFRGNEAIADLMEWPEANRSCPVPSPAPTGMAKTMGATRNEPASKQQERAPALAGTVARARDDQQVTTLMGVAASRLFAALLRSPPSGIIYLPAPRGWVRSSDGNGRPGLAFPARLFHDKRLLAVKN